MWRAVPVEAGCPCKHNRSYSFLALLKHFSCWTPVGLVCFRCEAACNTVRSSCAIPTPAALTQSCLRCSGVPSLPFLWRDGYRRTMDIAHDRAGYHFGLPQLGLRLHIAASRCTRQARDHSLVKSFAIFTLALVSR
jgi:hypothetical protein